MDCEEEVDIEGTDLCEPMEVEDEVHFIPSTPTVGGNSSTNSMQKKMSPLKHVTPILKKYSSQRQAKNGKCAKFKAKGKKIDGISSISNKIDEDVSSCSSVKGNDFTAGISSLEEALRHAEMCISASKENVSSKEITEENALTNLIEHSADQLPDVSVPEESVGHDGDEEGHIGTNISAVQPSNTSGRNPQQRKRNNLLKKRNRLQKDLEHALPLAELASPLSEDKCYAFALSYFQKLKERIEEKDPATFLALVQLLGDFDTSMLSASDLYHRAALLLSGHPDLCEEFLGFLLPHQALQCDHFIEHLSLAEMLSFLQRLEVYFAKQPQQLRKIYASWARLAESPDLSLELVRNTMLPLLRGNTFLIDSFRELLPDEKPPESKMTEFNLVSCEDMDSEHSGEEEAFECVEIPDEKGDNYGGDTCHCCCHDAATDPAFINRTKHCVPCGIKFVAGKLYLHTENGLRPTRIDFGEGNNLAHIRRLSPDPRKLSRQRRRGRTGNLQTTGRPEEGKQTVDTDDESMKTKSPRAQRPSKSSKQAREKPTSARSISLGRSTSRKLAGSKIDSSPPLNDQEAMSASDPSKDCKTSPLDFSVLSDVLRQDKENQLSGNLNEERIPNETSQGKVVNSSDGDSNPVVKRVNENTNVPTSKEDLDVGADKVREDSQEASWTREEDRIILETFQTEADSEKTFLIIREKLANRTLKEIQGRFQTLMSLIQQMR